MPGNFSLNAKKSCRKRNFLVRSPLRNFPLKIRIFYNMISSVSADSSVLFLAKKSKARAKSQMFRAFLPTGFIKELRRLAQCSVSETLRGFLFGSFFFELQRKMNIYPINLNLVYNGYPVFVFICSKTKTDLFFCVFAYGKIWQVVE